jgi:hypothetical protein
MADRSGLPTRIVPLLYFGTAYVSLGSRVSSPACGPGRGRLLYHSWMVALVHLVTLGWITFSILGAIYIVGPIARACRCRCAAAITGRTAARSSA